MLTLLPSLDYAITHPSMPNYIAAVSGSTQGSIFDDTRAHEFQRAPIDVKTVVDLLEDKEVSWGVCAHPVVVKTCASLTKFAGQTWKTCHLSVSR